MVSGSELRVVNQLVLHTTHSDMLKVLIVFAILQNEVLQSTLALLELTFSVISWTSRRALPGALAPSLFVRFHLVEHLSHSLSDALVESLVLDLDLHLWLYILFRHLLYTILSGLTLPP